MLSSTFDDWEPAVATDPKAPYVYLLTTRYGTRDCGSHCPSPFIPITISSDGGATWSAQVPICECDRSKAQYDPTIEVVPNTALWIVDQHEGRSLTIFTCHPIGSSAERLVVRADLRTRPRPGA